MLPERMSHEELERRAGQSVKETVVMFVLDGHTYRKLPDGSWEQYPNAAEVRG